MFVSSKPSRAVMLRISGSMSILEGCILSQESLNGLVLLILYFRVSYVINCLYVSSISSILYIMGLPVIDRVLDVWLFEITLIRGKLSRESRSKES